MHVDKFLSPPQSIKIGLTVYRYVRAAQKFVFTQTGRLPSAPTTRAVNKAALGHNRLLFL